MRYSREQYTLMYTTFTGASLLSFTKEVYDAGLLMSQGKNKIHTTGASSVEETGIRIYGTASRAMTG